jgi:hypothetical protein
VAHVVYREAMLIAEDLLLLLTDDDTGKAAGSTQVDLGLAGALTADLALLARVDIAAPGQPVKKGRLVVKAAATDHEPPELSDDLLSQALAKLATFEGKRPDKAVEALSKDIRRLLYLRLTERGLVRQHDSKLFGITLRTTWPAAERTHEQLLRANLARAVASDGEVPERDAALLSILAAVGRLDVVAGGAQTALTRRDIRRKNREMSSQWWVSEAVREAVKRVNSRNSAVAASAATAAVVAST